MKDSNKLTIRALIKAARENKPLYNLLRKHKCFNRFIDNTWEQRAKLSLTYPDTLKNESSPTMIIFESFVFHNTPENYQYWAEVAYDRKIKSE